MYAMAIHGGAGALPRRQFTQEREQDYRQSLAQALAAGQRLLEARRRCAGCGGSRGHGAGRRSSVQRRPRRGAERRRHGRTGCRHHERHRSARRSRGAHQHIRNPIQLARRVLEVSPHVFLVGDGAESFADENGFSRVPNDYFLTPYRVQQLRAIQHPQSLSDPAAAAALDEPPLGTVGAVARDTHGQLAAATSTGGLAGKRPGRVGDSPVIGAGTYADNRTCAVSTTGHGEWFLRTVQAYDIAARLFYGGYTLAEAVNEAITQRLTRLGATGGLIAVDRSGEIVMQYNTPAMFRACVRSGEAATIEVY